MMYSNGPDHLNKMAVNAKKKKKKIKVFSRANGLIALKLGI